LIGFELDFRFNTNTNHIKKRIHPTFIALNSAPKGLFTAADLT